MKLYLKKGALSTIIPLLACFNIYTMSPKILEVLLIPELNSNSTHNIENTNVLNKNCDTIIEKFYDLETGNYYENKTINYYNNDNRFDTKLSNNHLDSQLQSNNHNSSNRSAMASNETDWKDNLLNEQSKDQHVEGMRYNQEIGATNINSQFLDFQLILDKVYTIQDLTNALLSPTILEHLQQIKDALIYRHNQIHHLWTAKPKMSASLKRELDFIDALLSGEIVQLLEQMEYSDLRIAEAAFDQLKELWIWRRKNMFLGPDLTWGSLEPKFIKLLGINIMSIAEKGLITRPDYIAKYADTESLKIIQSHKEHSILLQQKGDHYSLFCEAKTLYDHIKKNGKKEDFTTNICYAITIQTVHHPLTIALHNIAHAPSLEKAHKTLRCVENQILAQASKENINLDSTIKDWITEKYGFDVLAALCDCYKSRGDYSSQSPFINLFSRNLPNNESILSNPLYTVLHKIQQKPLPIAHAELTRLVKQVLEQFESLNITDSVKQKQILIEDFSVDVIELANNTYKNHPEYKALVHSFIPLDVQKSSIDILSNHPDYASVGHAFDIMAEHVFHNARLCKLDYVPEVEAHVMDSLQIIKAPRNDAEFVFNVTVVDHLLSDMQSQADAIIQGELASLKRIPELFTRAVEKFINGLNPITQVTSLCELVEGISHLSNKTLNMAVDAIDHPIDALQNALEINAKACDFLVNTARFTSDLTIGKLYLAPEEYKQRTDPFWKKYDSIVTGENIADLVGQVAADFAFGKGLGIAFVYLKEIDAASKLQNQATKIANRFKQAVDTHLANNPILVTAEGVALQMSNDLKNVGGVAIETITSSRMLIESMTSGLLAKVRQDIINLKEKFTCIEKCIPECAKRGFAEFKNGHIKIAYEHILGIELIWNDVKNTLSGISGFHHDFMGTVEKSGLMKFIRTAEKNGCYMADIIVDGQRIPGKTFFPQHWSREEVISKIYEAYADFNKSGITLELNAQGKYIIHGYTSEGIKIEMIVSQKGHMKSAYPSFKDL